MVVRARVRGLREERVTGHSQASRKPRRSSKISLDMTRANIHRPPSQAIVAELVRAGVSEETAMAMERWKAQEVLELLRFGPDPLVPGGIATAEKRTGAW
jgi:hypothetical protein